MASNLFKNVFFQLQRRYLQSSSTSPLPTVGPASSSFTVQFLVNSCGLSLESALSVSQKIQLQQNNQKKAQSIAEFLKSRNFSDTQLAKLIVRRPEVLHCQVKRNVQPKIDYFIKIGFVGELLPRLILSNPRILSFSLDSTLMPSFNFLRSVLDSNEKILLSIKRDPWLLTSNLEIKMQPNINFLLKERVPARILADLLALRPRVLMLQHDRIVYAVNAAKNLGFEPTSPMFVRAFRILTSLSEATWKKKFEVLKSFGFNEEEILSAFKREPLVLGCSEEKMKKAIDFYINTMKLDPEVVILNPKIVNYALEKRIIPRYNVLKVLESKKLIPRINKAAAASLTMSEEKFMKKYVLKYMVEVPGLLEMYPAAENFLKNLIEKLKGDVPALLKIYPGAENFLKKYLER